MSEETEFLYFDRPASVWTEAIPLGNGSIGAMVYGGAEEELIQLNHDTLWSGYPRDNTVPGSAKYFKRARELALQGRLFDAQKVIESHCQGPWTHMFLPLGDLSIRFDKQSDMGSYRRTLSLRDSAASVTYGAVGKQVRREYFLSFPHKVLAVRVTTDIQKGVSFSVFLSGPLKTRVFVEEGFLIMDGECPSDCRTKEPGFDRLPFEYSEVPAERAYNSGPRCGPF